MSGTNPPGDSISGPTPRKGRFSFWGWILPHGQQPRPDALPVRAFLFLRAAQAHSEPSAAVARASSASRSRLMLVTAQSGSWVKGFRM